MVPGRWVVGHYIDGYITKTSSTTKASSNTCALLAINYFVMDLDHEFHLLEHKLGYY